MSTSKSHVFGPVPSRRLGRSLGVDLVPFKTCTYNCVYCQLGRTEEKTMLRKEYIPTDAIIKDLEEKLNSGVAADYITLSGSGEPTLHSGCGEIIEAIKKITDIPVAILTNGSLLWDPEVRKSLLKADLVVPSLDAGDAMTFKHVNRPHRDVDFDKMLEGLIQFRKEYSGRFWLEVFMLEGMNALESDVKKLAECADRINPDRIQLNTVARPPAYDFAAPVREEKMYELAALFGPKAEVVADFKGVHDEKEFTVKREDVLDVIERRPCTIDDISNALGIHRNEAVKHLDSLAKSGHLTTEGVNGKLFYKKAVTS